MTAPAVPHAPASAVPWPRSFVRDLPEDEARRDSVPSTRAVRRFAQRVVRRAARLEDPLERLAPSLRDMARAAERARPLGRTDVAFHAALARVAELTLGMRPFATQVMTGRALLDGAAVEMDTGEGKTLSLLGPAVAHALRGRHVHVLTANDYLAARDGAQLRPAIEAAGLSVGIVEPDASLDAKRRAYAADIVFGSNKEIAFDHLRDRLRARPGYGDPELREKMARALGGAGGAPPVLRGLDVAIVDEIDSILIDDSVTPLLLSESGGSSRGPDPHEAIDVAAFLEDGLHFTRGEGKSVSLTDDGADRAAALTQHLGDAWRVARVRDEAVTQALQALHAFRRGEDYIVDDGKVVLVDRNTGRPMPDRSLSEGLHGMIEAREGCEATGERRTLLSTTYQAFFRSYRRLSGTSGTIREVRGELRRSYGLPFRRTPRRLPLRRRRERPSYVRAEADVAPAVLRTVRRASARGQPVLVGTRSVREAEMLADALRASGLVPTLLSAATAGDEAAVVREAGRSGAITVATAIAGRGTDIMLDEAAQAAGGLHVVLCQHHAAGRVDRQFIGRSARQGDPGSFTVVAARDDLVLELGGRVPVPSRRAARGQRVLERMARRQRVSLEERAAAMLKLTAFTGGEGGRG